jgi:hypothetical protein
VLGLKIPVETNEEHDNRNGNKRCSLQME